MLIWELQIFVYCLTYIICICFFHLICEIYYYYYYYYKLIKNRFDVSEKYYFMINIVVQQTKYNDLLYIFSCCGKYEKVGGLIFLFNVH